jgi:hypothetical protein
LIFRKHTIARTIAGLRRRSTISQSLLVSETLKRRFEMLMQNFKSATDLGITEPQKNALMKTLVLLETGKLTHVPDKEIKGDMPKGKRTFSGMFNMGAWSGADAHRCGTICCIGGTAELIGNVTFGGGFGRGIESPALKGLFYPSIDSWDSITTEEAATALRSYLTTGDARWDLAVAPSRT